MRIAVLYQEKRFIVVVSPDSTVDDLKSEIQRVYYALFTNSHPPQPILEVLTVTGCVLYGGYTVSSVLADNDTITALGAADSTSHDAMMSPPLSTHLSGYPYLLPFYGVNPMAHQSPMFNNSAGMMDQSYTATSSPSKYFTPTQSHGFTSRTSLFQSPAVRTVGSQFPSPSGDAPQSNPHQVSGRSVSQVEEPTTEESESPLQLEATSLSISTGVSRTGKSQALSTRAPRPVDSGARKSEQTSTKKNIGSTEKHAEMEKVKKTLLSSGSATSKKDMTHLDSHPSDTATTAAQVKGKQTHSSPERKKGLVLKSGSKTSLQRKRKLAPENSGRDGAKKAKLAPAPKASSDSDLKPAVTQKNIDSADSSSDWTTSDESGAESGNKVAPTSLKKSKSKSRATLPSKSELGGKKEKSATQRASSNNRSQRALDASQTTAMEEKSKNRMPHRQPASELVQQDKGKKAAPDLTMSSSSSEWTSDDEINMEESVTPKPVKKKGKENHSQNKASTLTTKGENDKRRKIKKDIKPDAAQASSIDDDEVQVVSAVESVEGGGDGSSLLDSWTDASPKTGSYTAHDGRRLKEKRPREDLIKQPVSVTPSAKDSKDEEVCNEVNDNGSKGDIVHRTTPEANSESKAAVGTKSRQKVVKDVTGSLNAGRVSSEGGEILAPNSLPSDDEMTANVKQSQDAVTVIQESQDVSGSSRSTSPEIPYLNQPQPLAARTHQKMNDEVKLREKDTVHTPIISGSKKKCDEKETRGVVESVGECVRSQNDGEGALKKNKKLKLTKKTKRTSQSEMENSDIAIAGSADGNRDQLPDSNVTGRVISDSSDTLAEGAKRKDKKKRLKKKRVVESDATIIPSSQTDAETGHQTSESSSDSWMSEEEIESQVTTKSLKAPQTKVKDRSTKSQLEKEQDGAESDNDSSASVPVSDSQERPVEKKENKHKKIKKRKGTSHTNSSNESQTEEKMNGFVSQNTGGDMLRSVDGPSCVTDYNTTDFNSDCSHATTLSQDQTKKRKKKQKKRVKIRAVSEAKPRDIPSQLHTSQSMDPKSPSSVTPTKATSSPAHDAPSQGREVKGVFLKPSTAPPGKPSMTATALQLSPAAKISNSNGNRATPKGNSLSVFSVTETEPSSEESSCEGKGHSSRGQERKPQKLNLLSSLGSHGKRLKVARRSAPFSRTSLLTPSPSSRFSSESAVRLFSLTHSPRSGTAVRRARHTPTLSPSKTKKRGAEKTGPSIDKLLKEASSKDEEPSLSELLADSSLWES